jgi:hypothetical protein
MWHHITDLMCTCLSRVNKAVSLAARTSCLLQNHVPVWLNEPEGWSVADLDRLAACSRCTLEGGFRSSQVEHLFSHETGVPSAGNATRTLG